MTSTTYYERTPKNALVHTEVLGTQQKLLILAKDVSKERTGVHAFAAIALDGNSLHHSTMNIDDGKDRIHFVNTAFKAMNDVEQAVLPAKDLQRQFNRFCLNLWAEWIGPNIGEPVFGDDDPQPQGYYLEPYILDDGSTIIFAPPGKGKSYVMLAQSVSLHNGITKIWSIPNKRKVLYINLERPAKSMRRRLALVNRALGLPSQTPLFMINRRGANLVSIIDAVRETIERYSIEVLILDSISRAGAGDMNANEVGNKIADLMNSFGLPWIGIGHTPRGDDSHLYGSQMFDGAADLMIRMVSHQEAGSTQLGVGLEWFKGNDVPHFKTDYYGLEFDEIGLSGFRRAREKEFPTLLTMVKTTMKEDLVRYLLAAGEDYGSHIASETGHNKVNVSKLLVADDIFRVTRKAGTRIYYGLKTEREQ